MKPIRVVAVALAGLCLPACSGDKLPAPKAAPIAASAPSSAPATAESSPSSPAPTAAQSTPPAAMDLGATFKFAASDGAQVSVQVLQHRSTNDAEGVEARLCNVGNGTITVTRSPWVLLYDGGESQHTTDISGGGLPAPAYPSSFDPRTLASGECARGWINYTMVPGKKPYGIAYKGSEEGRLVWKF